MQVTKAVVEREHEWTRERAQTVVPVANEARDRLGDAFGVDVAPVTEAQYEAVVDETYADGDRAVNVAAMTALLRDLDVEADYPGFIVDELLGRELAGMIAREQPLRMLAEATFHYADVYTHVDGPAGVDDLDAALAAGVQTRLPGWDWVDDDPFAIH
ncbi:hypothetical protein [Halanaeroarchaeum sulfurireducens]|uniref:DUF7984 domain-containing protein n=1 Tax=Halanaeroarchaeum sulfurireducens TaxID=1604004 RepID=A0A0F7PAJ4_9EURY|nr:hypothetical protein [Halanaeroarchaeum sulfurireducens]AKH97185.1 hypothetical protein HLASF_0689 [Halanaeroarchaeum sulfurireducens]ALG81586.1 hypothetical protein HLASA_0685 [Halanaeroarchaeum sulfurireducens]